MSIITTDERMNVKDIPDWGKKQMPTGIKATSPPQQMTRDLLSVISFYTGDMVTENIVTNPAAVAFGNVEYLRDTHQARL
jgi:hypothetical protein